MYRSVPHISPPQRFQSKFLTGIFISCISPPTIYLCQQHDPQVTLRRNSYTARSPWLSGNTEQLRNSPSIAMCSRECYSTLNGQTRGVLGKRRCLRCGQPLSVNLDHKVFEFLEEETDRCSYVL